MLALVSIIAILVWIIVPYTNVKYADQIIAVAMFTSAMCDFANGRIWVGCILLGLWGFRHFKIMEF
jgi:hypothetical protein